MLFRNILLRKDSGTAGSDNASTKLAFGLAEEAAGGTDAATIAAASPPWVHPLDVLPLPTGGNASSRMRQMVLSVEATLPPRCARRLTGLPWMLTSSTAHHHLLAPVLEHVLLLLKFSKRPRTAFRFATNYRR